MLDACVKLGPEFSDVIVDAVHVCAGPGHTLGHPACLIDLIIAKSGQRQLRRVKRHSVRAVDRGRRPEGHECLVPG